MFDVSLKDVCCVFFFSFFSLHFVESVAQHKHTRLMKLESYRIWFIYCYFAVGARVLTYETVLGLFYIYTNCVHVTWQKAGFFFPTISSFRLSSFNFWKLKWEDLLLPLFFYNLINELPLEKTNRLGVIDKAFQYNSNGLLCTFVNETLLFCTEQANETTTKKIN